MLVERSPVARIECDHGHRDRIALVLEKQRQVGRFDIPQLYLCLHPGLHFLADSAFKTLALILARPVSSSTVMVPST